MRDPRRAGALLTALVLVAGPALTACGPSPAPVPTPLELTADDAAAPGLDGLAGSQVAERVVDAARSAGPVHVTGTYTAPAPLDEQGRVVEDPESPPHTLTLDVRGTPERFTARLQTDGIAADLVRDGNDVYARGDAGLGSALGEPRVADGWVRFDAADPDLEPWLVLTDVPALVASFLTPRPEVTLSDARATEGPGSALQVEISSRRELAGTLTIAPDDPVPTALAVVDPTGSGDLRFEDWGVEHVPEVPTGAVDHADG